VFVPDDFEPPTALAGTRSTGEAFRLEPLGPEHNERDHRAWMSSIEHIRSSPGFAGRRWPHEMTLDENAGDLVAHAEDFSARRGSPTRCLTPMTTSSDVSTSIPTRTASTTHMCAHGSAPIASTLTQWFARAS